MMTTRGVRGKEAVSVTWLCGKGTTSRTTSTLAASSHKVTFTLPCQCQPWWHIMMRVDEKAEAGVTDGSTRTWDNLCDPACQGKGEGVIDIADSESVTLCQMSRESRLQVGDQVLWALGVKARHVRKSCPHPCGHERGANSPSPTPAV
ncbi:hypothetical protein TcWFU_006617 [Taenia crassiceps]|uniref:Uncharacterized protein n=1 Tax=Taenia crassiceps TaxID=6207 RepID=A0ABR4PZB5_9CEST